jgi:endonuclease III
MAARKTRRPARRRVLAILERLFALYGAPDLGNKKDPLEELVFIALSRQTHEKNYTRTWEALRRGFPSWESLRCAEPEIVYEAIKDGGFARQKTAWIQATLERIRDRFGHLSLEALRALPDAEAERILLEMPGVNVKSARCIMMYSLGRDVLPVDTHVQRISERLGLIPEGLSSAAAHEALERIIPAGWRYRFHVGCILHGRRVCKKIGPECRGCVLQSVCAYGRGACAEAVEGEGDGASSDQPVHGGGRARPRSRGGRRRHARLRRDGRR